MPSGDYLVAAYPVAPFLADSNSDDFDTPDWQPSFAAGANAQSIPVTAGALAKADIAVPDGPAKLTIDFAYFDLWHYYGRTAKHGAFMGGADFVQWHGSYPLLKHTVEIKAQAEEMRRAHAKK